MNKKFVSWNLLFSLIFLVGGPAFAAIQNLELTVTNPTDFAKKYNNGQTISLSAKWDTTPAIATAPFAATFKVGDSPVGSVNTSKGESTFNIQASALQEGSGNSFKVSVIETSVANAVASPDAGGNGTVIVDRTPPQITMTISSGGTVSPQTGFNEVTFTFSSSEDLGEAPKFTISPGSGWGNPTAVIPEQSPWAANQYKVTVPGTMAEGAYTIKATCKDATLPADSRNEGTGQVSFTVDALAPGSPTINSSVPPSPSRITSISLSGTAPAESAGSQKIELFEGATSKGTTTIAANATDWTISVSGLSEGVHHFQAKRTDPLGNISALSAEYNVTIDKTAPSRPVLIQPTSPVKTTQIQILGSGTIDAGNSGPVKVYLFRDGTQIAQTNANADGSFSFPTVTLVSGNNFFFAQSADTTNDGTSNSGNQTTFSSPVTVVLDQAGPVVVGGGVVIGVPGSTARSGDMGIPGQVLASMEPGPSVQARFIPPIGSSNSPSRVLMLPVAAVQDRFADRTSVQVVFHKAGDSSVPEESIVMQKNDGVFTVEIPRKNEDVAYKFMFRDPAGNVSYFPPTGELALKAKRTDALHVSFGQNGSTSSADEWPVSLLGVPPVERMLAYRRLIVDPALVDSVKKALNASGNSSRIEVISKVQGSPAANLYQKDLDLLSEDRLPQSRLDLLLQEITNGTIPSGSLPKPESLQNKPEFKGLKDAIRFRLLHENTR